MASRLRSRHRVVKHARSDHWGRIKSWFTGKVAPLLVWAFVFQFITAAVYIIRLDARIGFLDQRLLESNARISVVSKRLDEFISAVERLETPLSRKVEGLEKVVAAMRDSQNEHTATYATRFDTVIKRLDSVFEKLASNDQDFTNVRQRITTNDGLIRELKNLSDQRALVVQRAEKGFEDIATLKDQAKGLREELDRRSAMIERANKALEDQAALKIKVDEQRRDIGVIDERIGRIVQALDSIYDKLTEHLIETKRGARKR